MYELKNGYWKSDFKIKRIRYQKTWFTKDKRKALKLENHWKQEIKSDKQLSYNIRRNNIEDLSEQITMIKSMTFKETLDYLYEVKWKFQRDYNNPMIRWKKISEYFGKDNSITRLTIDNLDAFKQYLVDKSYANKTINHYISTLKTSIELLEAKQKIILENKLSFEGLLMPTSIRRKICFTKEEERLMLKTLQSKYKETNDSKDWEMMQYFIINSGLGLRPNEYLNLQLGDIDLKEKTLTIARGSYNSTKNDLIRTLPLEGVVFISVILQLKYSLKYINKDTKTSHFYGLDNVSTSKLEEIINLNEYKKIKLTALSYDMMLNRWNKMKQYLGWVDKELYKEHIPYGLRHTVASRLASKNKWNGYKIMRFMGHKSFHTSLNYIHLDVEDIREGSCINNQNIQVIDYKKNNP